MSSAAGVVTEEHGWRWCKKCQGLWYAGKAPCPAGGCHDHVDSGNYSLASDVNPSPNLQSDWKWCSKCQVLSIQDGKHGTSPCSAGGTHDTSHSENFSLNLGTSTGQKDWKWCNKCNGLAWAGDSNPGVCQKDGGGHDHTGSGNYTLNLDGVPTGEGQDQWRFCRKCRLLAFDGNTICTVGGAHVQADSGKYTLSFSQTPGQQKWKWCKKCYGISYAGGQSLGPCVKGGMHDHTGSGDYQIVNDWENKEGFPPAGFQTGWSWCKKCQLLWFSDNGGARCPQGPLAYHDKDGSAKYAVGLE